MQIDIQAHLFPLTDALRSHAERRLRFALTCCDDHIQRVVIRLSDINDPQWDAMLELNGESRSKNRIGGVSEDNSCGDLVYLSPGIRLSSGSDWSLYISFGIPVHEDLNGVQADVDYRVVGGIGIAL